MECREAGRLSALHTCAIFDFTNRTPLGNLSINVRGMWYELLTSLQRCFEIFSTPVMGSMKTSFATLVSGIHMAHSR